MWLRGLTGRDGSPRFCVDPRRGCVGFHSKPHGRQEGELAVAQLQENIDNGVAHGNDIKSGIGHEKFPLKVRLLARPLSAGAQPCNRYFSSGFHAQ